MSNLTFQQQTLSVIPPYLQDPDRKIQDATHQLLPRVSDADTTSRKEDASITEFLECAGGRTILKKRNGNVQDVHEYPCDLPITTITRWRSASADGQT